MNVSCIGDFILSQWIWSVTFGLSHLFFSVIIMFLLLKLVMKSGWLASFFMTVASHACAVALFTLIAIGVVVHFLQWEYSFSDRFYHMRPKDILWACIMLGGIYALCQSLFFTVVQLFSRHRAVSYILLAIITNLLSAFLSYGMVRMVTWYAF